MATSVTLEVLFYFGWWYDAAFWLATIALFIYKGAPFLTHMLRCAAVLCCAVPFSSLSLRQSLKGAHTTLASFAAAAGVA